MPGAQYVQPMENLPSSPAWCDLALTDCVGPQHGAGTQSVGMAGEGEVGLLGGE